MPEFDLLVIGGGWGGYTAAQTLAQQGGRVALVEQDKIGGVCLHRGCIPTKALLETAAVVQAITNSSHYGIHVAEPELRWPETLHARDAIVQRLHDGMERALELTKVERIAGTAQMTGATSVRVRPSDGGAEVKLDARALVIATGSEPNTLPFLPVDGKRVITSDHAISLTPPKRAIVIGAGAVGMEFASLWTDLGGEVTVLELLPTVLPGEDRDISRTLDSALKARGAIIETNARIDPQSVKITARSVRFDYAVNGETRQAVADVVLVATGRRPRFEALAPGVAGVTTEAGAVCVDQDMRTNVNGVYAVGDVTGGLQLAHVAAAQGRFVAESLLERRPPPIDPLWMPRAVYTMPQVASIGLTEKQARESGRKLQVGRAHFSVNARALIHHREDGFVKLLTDAETGDLLGAHIVGPEATELIGQVSLGRFVDASAWELATAVQPHPTLSEAVAEAAQAAQRPKLRLTPGRSA
ncbi:MAG: dihydrolipoyl dehydrogenase [Dehalococcoidia bacterium]